jgi:hypothetical protein
MKNMQFDAMMEERGYPAMRKAMLVNPFDIYSDFFRGTIESMSDMMFREDVIIQFCKAQREKICALLPILGGMMPGKWVLIPLHKGMDGFMSPKQYEKLYWNDLQAIIECIIDSGMVPFIFTEGKYDTRIEFLKDVPKGKVLYHFENVDMIRAKKILGDTACITGGFPIYLLSYGTRQDVVDECKRLIDGCAAGGGFIFGTDAAFDDVKPENMEAMIDTVKTYGRR